MTVGYPLTKADVDSRAGSLAVDLRNKLTEIRNFKVKLDSLTDAELGTGGGLGYSTAEIANLRSAFTDMDKLAQIYLGLATQGSAYDFRTFAKFLMGVA